MAIFPVIMCGGAGSRLWPASRPAHPKQFLPLVSDRSLFRSTVRRVAPLAAHGGGRVIIVAGVGHRDWVTAQLADEGVQATVLLEPEARDSAPAMAAAAEWILRSQADGVAAFIASDHHIPDDGAFRGAVSIAARGAAAGRIVTLGVKPVTPSSAYGYIRPDSAVDDDGLHAIDAFVEKPDVDRARLYMADGYLWNSGNFIVRADVFMDEVRRHTPDIASAVRAAVAEARIQGDVVRLGPAFSGAVKLSTDYAVMEQTRLASVLPVDFEWSDLGAWDAVHAAAQSPDDGVVVRINAEGGLVRAAPGMTVAAIGVKDLAIIARPDAVLVCRLSDSQDVKLAVDRLKALGVDARAPAAESAALPAQARAYRDWLKLRALPLWSSLGVAEDGSFNDVMDDEARALPAPRRARVQPRQAYVYTRAGALGWRGPWRALATRALERFRVLHGRDDGLFRTRLDAEGRVLDDNGMVYDQAFVILTEASLGNLDAAATALTALAPRALDGGGFREAGSQPFQANAHMHLFEAALACIEAGGDARWTALADQLADLALTRFLDDRVGAIREFFDESWMPLETGDARLIEPGHQFEWAWLLERFARLRARPDASAAAQRLFAAGLEGVDPARDVALDVVDQDLSPVTRSARLWPQTERLKAALILAEIADGQARSDLLSEAAQALDSVWLYLGEDGLWRDRMLADGEIESGPAPASTFYHLIAAFEQLAATGRRLGLDGMDDLTLA